MRPITAVMQWVVGGTVAPWDPSVSVRLLNFHWMGPIFNRRQNLEALHAHNARAQAPSFIGHLLAIPKHNERPAPTEHTDAALPSSTLALREVDF